jgi:hypothetical protein
MQNGAKSKQEGCARSKTWQMLTEGKVSVSEGGGRQA